MSLQLTCCHVFAFSPTKEIISISPETSGAGKAVVVLSLLIRSWLYCLISDFFNMFLIDILFMIIAGQFRVMITTIKLRYYITDNIKRKKKKNGVGFQMIKQDVALKLGALS